MSATEQEEALFPLCVPPDTLSWAAADFLHLRKCKDEAEERAAQARALLEEAQERLLQLMAVGNVSSLRVGDVLLSAATRGYYSLPAGALDDPAVANWLYSAGGQDLLKRSVHPQTFSSFCRELVEGGHALHPAVRQALKRVVSVRGA